MDDLISRQLALDVMNGRFETLKQAWGDEIKKDGVAVYLDMRGIIEALPSAQPETCDTCKHGYFGDTQCDNCCVRYPSHYERRTDG